MSRVQYKTKTGLVQYKPVLRESRLASFVMGDLNDGWCLACGQFQDPVEPDARKYTCPRCSKPKVYGVSELLMMGLVKIN